MNMSSNSDLRKSEREEVGGISLETVAKFAMVEEIRSVSSKMDRLYNEIKAKIPLDEQYIACFRQMKEATIELKRARKEIKRKSQ